VSTPKFDVSSFAAEYNTRQVAGYDAATKKMVLLPVEESDMVATMQAHGISRVKVSPPSMGTHVDQSPALVNWRLRFGTLALRQTEVILVPRVDGSTIAWDAQRRQSDERSRAAFGAEVAVIREIGVAAQVFRAKHAVAVEAALQKADLPATTPMTPAVMETLCKAGSQREAGDPSPLDWLDALLGQVDEAGNPVVAESGPTTLAHDLTPALELALAKFQELRVREDMTDGEAAVLDVFLSEHSDAYLEGIAREVCAEAGIADFNAFVVSETERSRSQRQERFAARQNRNNGVTPTAVAQATAAALAATA
jgi:hypothetical protein